MIKILKMLNSSTSFVRSHLPLPRHCLLLRYSRYYSETCPRYRTYLELEDFPPRFMQTHRITPTTAITAIEPPITMKIVL